MNIDLLDTGRDRLGESAVWDLAGQALFWVDAVACKIRRHDPATGRVTEWTTPEIVGSIGLAGEGVLVAAMRDGFYSFDLATSTATPLARPGLGANERLNDGKVDRHGRFIAGTLTSVHGEAEAGRLFSLDGDATCRVLERGVAISNALSFSPSGERMYFADSLQDAIWMYDYDAAGAATNRRVFAETRQYGSAPDGATVDAEGHLWVAFVQNSRIARFRPDGTLDRVIDVPIPYPTCPAFGEAGLDVLFCTSISDSGGRLKTDHPDSGRVLRIEGLGTAGLPEPRYVPNRATVR